jgi:hypothetical protein
MPNYLCAAISDTPAISRPRFDRCILVPRMAPKSAHRGPLQWRPQPDQVILAGGPTLLGQLRRMVIFSSAQVPRRLGIDDWRGARGVATARFSVTRSVARSSISWPDNNLAPPRPAHSFPRKVAWLMLKQPEDAQSYAEEQCQRSPEIVTCASRGCEFCRIIRQRDAAAWLRWRATAPRSWLANFARHLCRDGEAVVAVLQQPRNNGPGRRARSPIEAHQMIRAGPRQLRFASLAAHEFRLNFKPTQGRRHLDRSPSKLRKSRFYSIFDTEGMASGTDCIASNRVSRDRVVAAEFRLLMPQI